MATNETLGDVKYTFNYAGIESEGELYRDDHSHTNWSDGTITLGSLLDEARENGTYEKGSTEHGNPVDEDINHPTNFLDDYEGGDQPYTSPEIYPLKYENINEKVDDIEGSTTLTDADPAKLRQDLERLYSEDDGNETSRRMDEKCLNYSMVVPHGVELDYNPAIESATGDFQQTIDSYEDSLIDFLKEAESRNSGFNYVLLSSHYVNTPFQPHYIKKGKLFDDMSHGELGGILESYRDKEIAKIESLSSKLGDMSIPEVSGELMTEEEQEELEKFIYDQSQIADRLAEDGIGTEEMMNASERSAEIARPGVVAVGAHPTLIERNEEMMDYFRREQGLTTKQEISEDLTDRMSENFDKSDVDEMLGEEAQCSLYPEEELRKYYKPMLEAGQTEENFIFEVNGKGVERQHPSVFWRMLDKDKKAFGSDAHRPEEGPERCERFAKMENTGKTIYISDLWLSQLEDLKA